MLVFATKNVRLFLKIAGIRFLRNFIAFKISFINCIEDASPHARVISHFSTESKHGKTTAQGRFRDIDEITINYINEFPAPHVHDIAVSSGITSHELYAQISILKPNTLFFISDKYSKYFASGKKIISIFGAEHKLLFGYIFMIYAAPDVQIYCPVSRIAFIFLRIKNYFSPPKILRPISLLNLEIEQLISNEKIHFIDYDAFSTRYEDKFDYVRCMNLLNLNSWFKINDIVSAVINISASIKENGILQIGRTEDETGVNRVSFYRKIGDHLMIEQKVNGGSELAALISGLGDV